MSVSAPTGLTATALSPTQVKLTWNDVTGDTGYNVYRWDGVQSVLAGSVAKDVTTFTVTNLTANQTQYFSVEAHDLATTARSSWVTVTTPADAITLPTNIHFTNITLTTMTLQWNNATGATGYNIYHWDGTQTVLIGAATPSLPAFKATNLAPGTVNYFYIQAFNKTNSINTDWVSASTLGYTLTAPTGFKTTTINAGTIGLSWNDATGETGYRIYQWDGNSFDSPIVIANLAANTTGFQVTGLLPGTRYWYYVQAFNSAGSANSPWVAGQTLAAIPLQPVGQLTAASTGPNSIQLNWIEPARAAGYRVFVWNGYAWNLAGAVAAGNHTMTVTNLPRGMTYWFYIQAYTDSFAEVSYSNVVYANL
jgi:hypothetical protein